MSEPFALDFGLKSVEEVEHEGQDGLLLTGYATRFGEVDQSGEHMTKGALRDLEDTWGQQPIVLFEHGLSDLGTRRIGQAIDHQIDSSGLRVSVFVPKEPGWKDQRAVRAFRDVYAQIKRGVLRGFSVGGTYTRDAAGAIKRWSMLELSVVSRPCLPSATFAVGAKAVAETYGEVPPALDPERSARVAIHFLREDAQAVAEPQTASALAELLSRVEALEWEAATKAARKKEPDGAMHPPDHYLVVEDPDKASTFHLQVKNASGDYDRKLCAQAYAALTSNFRGNPYSGPNKQVALKKLRAIYTSQGWEWPADEGSGSGKKGDLARSEAAWVLREFSRQTKAGRMHSAATVAAVRKIADGLQGHVDALRDHFGVEEQDEEGEQEQDHGAPLTG